MSRRVPRSPLIASSCLVLSGLLLAGCAQQTSETARRRGFSPSEYGVAASPRVVEPGQPVPRGGGAYRVGRPYVVRGRTYTPREDPGHEETGIASWYGDDFHGRRTANGEIYDQYALSAAHPTLPTPSYVRVTNLLNNRSVVVRVNDRGPFHSNRVIDLSRRAAQLLEVRGLGRVRVTYFGRANLDGRDDWLVTTVRNNGRAVPPQQVAAMAPVPDWARHRPDAGATVQTAFRQPLNMPVPLERPRDQPVEVAGLPAPAQPAGATTVALATPGTAPGTAGAAPLALASVARPATAAAPPAAPTGASYVHVGVFRDHAQASRYREGLARHGSVQVEPVTVSGIGFYQVRIGPIAHPAAAEAALRDAQGLGATGARIAPIGQAPPAETSRALGSQAQGSQAQATVR